RALDVQADRRTHARSRQAEPREKRGSRAGYARAGGGSGSQERQRVRCKEGASFAREGAGGYALARALASAGGDARLRLLGPRRLLVVHAPRWDVDVDDGGARGEEAVGDR